MINHGLAGRVALVTGVSRQAGIGAAIARAFAEAGADVFTTYYRPYDELMPWGSNAGEAEEIVKGLKEKGVRAEGVEADLADPEAGPAYSLTSAARSASSTSWLITPPVIWGRMFTACLLF